MPIMTALSQSSYNDPTTPPPPLLLQAQGQVLSQGPDRKIWKAAWPQPICTLNHEKASVHAQESSRAYQGQL